jgi:hypothetical protein
LLGIEEQADAIVMPGFSDHSFVDPLKENGRRNKAIDMSYFFLS